MRKIETNGIKITMDDDARELQYYIQNHLTREEFDTIFGYAKYRKKAYFQDRDRHHFEVLYDDGTFMINEIN